MVKKKQFIEFKSGYSKTFGGLNVAFNKAFSIVLIIFSIPILIIISLLIKFLDGGQVFYSGIRLGLNKKPYKMYKFRTLTPNEENIIGCGQTASKDEMVTKMGKFLRDTRLDELPQLFNILNGDMCFVGPRPERPSVYEKICKNIMGYDKRFSVKPGLIGYSQLFTPHNCPKRIRTLIDNSFIRRKQFFLWDIIIVIYTILIVTRIAFRKISLYLQNNIWKSMILRLYNEKRVLERVILEEAVVYFGPVNSKKYLVTKKAVLKDINQKAFLMFSDCKVDQNDSVFRMEIKYKKGFGKKRKTKCAICTGKVHRECKIKHNRFKYSYVIFYEPISSLNSYIINQYLLLESMYRK